MSDKISPWAVAREAVALSWRRKWTFFGLSLVVLASMLAAMGLASSWRGPGVALAFCLHILASLFLMTTANHLAVTMQRGAGAVLPHPFWPTMGRVFVRGLVLVAVVFGVLLVAGIPIGALAYSSLSHDPAGPAGLSPALFALFAIAGSVVYAFLFGLFLRLMVMIPGAAVGRVVGVREALALTRGHVWRMFWSTMIVALPVMILTGLFEVFIATSATDGEIGAGVILLFLFLLVFDLFVWIVMLVMNAVWYEKLCLRMHTARDGSGPAFAFATAPDPRAGSGVGPYADLPDDMTGGK